ncbi:MAG: HTTM domain-containing protein [Deltaproteobacteria bacterium]|nr:HTTM domain-containing protein [Deltaproteobacteria bacterium]
MDALAARAPSRTGGLLAAARNIGRWVATPFAIDLRGLAVFRIGLGLNALALALMQARDAEALFSDIGVLPREVSKKFINLPGSFALDFLSGATWFGQTMAILGALAALALILGWRTRIATIVCWALMLGARERNLLAADGGDDIVVLFLFWGMFLPLGAHLSLDARRRTEKPPATVTSFASAGFVLQLFCLYFFAALLKTGPQWRVNGNALYTALSLDMMNTPFAVWLRQYKSICRLLTFGTFYLEFWGPLLLIAPVQRTYVRAALVAGFIGLHLGIAMCLQIPLFAFSLVATWLALVPGAIWDRLGWRVGTESAPPPTGVRRYAIGLAQGLAALSVVLVLLCNLAQLPGAKPQATVLRWLNQALGISQAWTMFSPDPLDADGWMVFPAQLADGSRVDLYRGGPETYERPANVPASYGDTRWRNVLTTVSPPEAKPLQAEVLRYLCLRWNREHPPEKAAKHVGMIYMLEQTTPDDPAPPATKRPLIEADCAP